MPSSYVAPLVRSSSRRSPVEPVSVTIRVSIIVFLESFGMREPSIIQALADKRDLLEEWSEAAATVARNLGLDKPLPDLAPEHWQLVLAGVGGRMRLRGATPPPGWQRALAR